MKGEEQNLNRHPVLDDAFWVAAAVAGVATTISVLIMGIFSTSSGDRIVMIAGLNVILAGPAVLLLMIVARLASRAFAGASSHDRRRMTVIVSGLIYSIGLPIMLAVSWHLVQLCIQSPVDREAAVDTPSSPAPAY
jgi:hypothetical protein